MKDSDVALVIVFCFTLIIIVSIGSGLVYSLSNKSGDRNEIQTVVAA